MASTAREYIASIIKRISAVDTINLERLLDFAQVVLVVASSLAIAATLATYLVSKNLTKKKDEKFQKFQVSAESDIAEANQKAQEAVLGQQKLQVEIGRSQLEREKLHYKNLELEKKVEEARVARLILEQRLAPRTFNEKQRKTLIEELSRFRGQKAKIFVISTESEITNFGNQLIDILQKSKWRIEKGRGLVMGNPPPSDIVVEVKDENKFPLAARVLIVMLKSLGFAVHPQVDRNIDDLGKIKITVGKKTK